MECVLCSSAGACRSSMHPWDVCSLVQVDEHVDLLDSACWELVAACGSALIGAVLVLSAVLELR